MATGSYFNSTALLKLFLIATVQIGPPNNQALSDGKSSVFGYIYTIPTEQLRSFSRITPTYQLESKPSTSRIRKSKKRYRRPDNRALEALQRLQDLMKTDTYYYYFPGPNYFNAYVPQNYSQAKTTVSKEQLKQLDFAYLPKTIEAESLAIENHIATFLKRKPPSLHTKESKVAQAREYLATRVCIIAQLADGIFVLLLHHKPTSIGTTSTRYDISAYMETKADSACLRSLETKVIPCCL
ncbi:hypothetical protein J3R30DRAFT_3443108 [Lentinula aciculospora]|uniref:Uncharacterized protein n=1 Tax=Lentinula aciculospora TaxID=153920 RepID=A0A9W9APL3_9AGAR|nr:hypothetical protein J3R30DRAFT_3443108 [Lentinula aciculospora]